MLDQTPGDAAVGETARSEDDALYCAGCGHLITRGRWRIQLANRSRIPPIGRQPIKLSM